MGLRICKVACRDLNGVEHVIEVTANSLYEAVAQGLRVFRENDWVEEVGRGQTTISVVVKQPEVQHNVRAEVRVSLTKTKKKRKSIHGPCQPAQSVLPAALPGS